MERRLHTRHRARTTVYVVMSGRKSRICKAKNLSANGVFVETENLGLRKGQQVQLAFGVQSVEYQRGLPGSAHSGHDDQFVMRKIEVEVLEIVLPRAADADDIRAGRIEGWHSSKFTGCVKPALGRGEIPGKAARQRPANCSIMRPVPPRVTCATIAVRR